jgi:hypothetical protein
MKLWILPIWTVCTLLPLSPLGKVQGGAVGAVSDILDPCSTSNQAFVAGEELVYKIYYNWNFVWLSAGEVVFTVKETKDELHMSAVGKTYPSYEWFFKVRDYYSTVVDKQTMLPKHFYRDIEEGGFKFYNRVDFDQSTRKAVSYKGKYATDPLTRKEYDLPNCMHDLVSILYYLRNVKYSGMRNNAVFPVQMFLDDQVYDLKVTYKGVKTNKKVKSSGIYHTIHFSPETIAGNQFKEGTVMDVYVGNDTNKVPVLVESPVSVGSIKAVLIRHTGLKHAFQSKIE